MVTRSMFRDNANLVVDGYLIKQLLGSGLVWLDRNKEKVNQLNVFPVPDGDTGTNMFLTMRHAYKEVADMETNHVGDLAAALAEGALKGARGNSGVILSQLWAGVADALRGEPMLNAELLVAACRSAVKWAYNAVEKPVEGTILTVSREMAEAVEQRYEREPDLVALLKAMVFAGRASLRRTPEMLPVLKKAGVVDSGGQGLVYIFEGMLRALCGKDVYGAVEVPAATQNWQEALVPEDDEGYGYDVQFLMRGKGLRLEEVRAAIQAMGWSTLVVGDDQLIKVHVHVHNPGDPLSYAIGLGASIDDVVVENMQEQYESYVQDRLERETEATGDIPGVAVITVANGKGLHRVFSQQFGAAYVITGGQTMNPSTGDFLNAINLLPNTEIILLPNNKNIFLAAQQAATKAEYKRVRVVPSTSIPQGINAMIEYTNVCSADEGCSLDDVANRMSSALRDTITLEVTTATRGVEIDGIQVRAGQLIGLLEDALVIAGEEMLVVVRDLLKRANADNHERITLYYGSDVTEKQAQALVEALQPSYPDQEFEIVGGGQPLYPYIISVE